MKSGIYFLIDRKTIVYIGQTHRFPCRFNTVNAEFVFDRIRFVECSVRKLLYYERRWIDKFRPKYNTMNNKDKVHPLFGKTNLNAGRLTGTSYFDLLKEGEIVRFKKKYHPTNAIFYFNKTRSDKKLGYCKIDGNIYIKRLV